jgi:formylglycine-generating enzyme required for sulfatase activity
MGSPAGEEERSDAEGPQHQVTIGAPFALGRFAVTLQEFSAFVEAEAHAMPDEMYTYEQEKWEVRKGRSFRNPGFLQTARHPVIGVSWDDSVAYCKWLSRATGKDYRLASEAEWEFACRAGTATPFWWGSSISTDDANYNGNYIYGGGKKGQYRKATVPVESFKTNPWGLYQMHGNVWEWCADNWRENYRGAPEDGSVWQGGDRSLRVLRGGSWNFIPQLLRAAYRGRGSTGSRDGRIGFRLARTLTP